LHALDDKVSRRDVLERAWEVVRRNRGAPGIDQVTIQQVEWYGVDRLLDKLAASLKDGSYQPQPARRVFIPKPGTAEQRPLSIPAVADRIVQAAVRLVAEPIFEADMLACSFGFRPRRSAHDALQVLIDEAWRGRRWVVETDIANCFEATSACQADTGGRRTRLRPERPEAAARHAARWGNAGRNGPPAGHRHPARWVASPLLCNVYLHRLDRAWDVREHGVLVRYADDGVPRMLMEVAM